MSAPTGGEYRAGLPLVAPVSSRVSRSPFPPLRALVFDMDGTLYQNEQLNRKYIESFYRILAEVKGLTLAAARRRFEKKYCQLHDRFGRTPSKLYTLTRLGVSDQAWARQQGRQILPESFLKPDPRLRRALSGLREQFRLALVTNNHRLNLQTTLKALGVADCFDEILTLTESRLFKPSSRLYRVIAERLHVLPAECLSIGDRYELDLEPAGRVGMQTLLVRNVRDIYRLPNLVRPVLARVLPASTPGQSRRALAEATRALGQDHLAVIPTDTVYGMAARLTPRAIRWIYRAKGRAEENPLSILLSDPEAVRRYAVVTARARELMARFWPGALTLVLPAKAGTPWGKLTRGGRTLALRVPDQTLCRRIIRKLGGALVVTSANPSGQAAPWSARNLDRRILAFSEVVIDAGKTPVARPSTIVRVQGSRLKVLRVGTQKIA